MKEFLPLSLSLSLSLSLTASEGIAVSLSFSLSLSLSFSLSSSCLPRSPLRFDLRYRILKIVTFLAPQQRHFWSLDGPKMPSSFCRFLRSNLAALNRASLSDRLHLGHAGE